MNMQKEEISFVAQLLGSMKDAVIKLEKAYKKKDAEMLISAKQEILKFQAEIRRVI